MHPTEFNPLKQRLRADELVLIAENIVTPLFHGSQVDDLFCPSLIYIPV